MNSFSPPSRTPGPESVDIADGPVGGFVVTINDTLCRAPVPVWWGFDLTEAGEWANRFRRILHIVEPVRDLTVGARRQGYLGKEAK